MKRECRKNCRRCNGQGVVANPVYAGDQISKVIYGKKLSCPTCNGEGLDLKAKTVTLYTAEPRTSEPNMYWHIVYKSGSFDTEVTEKVKDYDKLLNKLNDLHFRFPKLEVKVYEFVVVTAVSEITVQYGFPTK